MRSNHLSYEPNEVSQFTQQIPARIGRAGFDDRKGNEDGGTICRCLVIAGKRHERRYRGKSLERR